MRFLLDRYLLLCALLCLTPALPADALGDLHFESVGTAQTIPDNNVTALVEDRDGYLWIGTPNGLVRYDGYNFQRYTRDPKDLQSISGAFIRTLLVARDGRLWIGTDADGVSIYDPTTRKFARLRHAPDDAHSLANDNVRGLAEDADGIVYIGTRAGINRYDPRTQKMQRLVQHLGPDTTRVEERILGLLIDRRGNVWAASWNGLGVLKPGAAQFERVQSSPGEMLAGQLVLTLFELRDGRIGLSTSEGGCYLLDAQTHALVSIALGVDTPMFSADATVLAMLQPRDNELWLGGFGGIAIVHPESGRLLRYLRTDPAVNSSLAHTQVRTFLQDRAGQIWIGGYSGGLQRHDPNNVAVRVLHHSPMREHTLSHPSVSSMLELDDGQIWVGTRANGIDFLNPRLGVVGGLRPQPGKLGALGNGVVIALEQTRDGSIWAGTLAGLFRINRERQVFQSFNAAQGLIGTTVRRLLRDPNGALWIGSNAGLSRWDPSKPSHVASIPTTDGDSLSAEINAIARSGKGDIWVGSSVGLYVLEAGSTQLKAVATIAADASGAITSIVGLLIDSQDQLWVDTSEGLLRLQQWDGKTASFKEISTPLGIGAQPFGANLLEDAKGRIWSQRFVYDPKDQSVYELGLADGVDMGTAWFRSYAKTRSGLLLFGGAKGLLMVDPTRFEPWAFAPIVVATSVKVDGVEHAPVSYAKRLELAPGTRNFSVEFAALDFSAPERNRYAYQLQGFDPEFIEVDARHRMASYTNLAPGDYRLIVRGSSRTGQFSPHELHIDVRSLPRFWQTLWFAATAAAVALLALVIGFRAHSARIRRHERALQQMVEERTAELFLAKEKAETALTQLKGAQRQLVVAEKMASLGQLVAGVAHEINTPLGIALTASSMLSEESKSIRQKLQANVDVKDAIDSYFELAERASALVDSNLARAAHLVRSFKQVSVDRSLDERRRFDLGEYLSDLRESLKTSWRQRPVELDVDCEPGLLLDSYPGTLGQVIDVLTQNSLLHAFDIDQPGLMRLTARPGSANDVRMIFSDNGKGIALTHLPRVFEPFFTTRRSQGSTGLGLHIVFNLVSARLGGHIEVRSTPGVETRFILTFPRVAPQ